MEQLSLFPDEETRPQVKRPKRNGGSNNPIVFHDYESFIAKFADNPKTTARPSIMRVGSFVPSSRTCSLTCIVSGVKSMNCFFLFLSISFFI